MKKFLYIAMAAFMVTACNNDDDEPIGVITADTDFSGTFAQADQMGRPGINTVFTPTDADENEFNRTIPANMIAEFQPTFLNTVGGLYTAYGAMYENNVLGLDAAPTTTALALMFFRSRRMGISLILLIPVQVSL